MKCIVLIIGFVMLLLSAWCILGNISLAIISFVNKKSRGSFVPLLGCAAGIIGILCIDSIPLWCICFAFLDLSFWCLPCCILELIRELRCKKTLATDDEGFSIFVDGELLRKVPWSHVDFTRFRMTSHSLVLYLRSTPVEIITIRAKYDGYDSFLHYFNQRRCGFER